MIHLFCNLHINYLSLIYFLKKHLFLEYADNVDCLLSVNENMTECNRAAETIYTEYAEFKRNHIPERDEPYIANNALCV